MDSDGQQLHQLMLERQERLEEALIKAEAGKASPEDWEIIRYECGVARRPNSIFGSITRSE